MEVRLGFIILMSMFLNAEAIADNSQQQDSILEAFVDNIATFNRVLPQEKVYLHFDNSSYFLGETIWFSAYVVTSEAHRATQLSRILYVELVSQEGIIVDSKRLKIEDGRCHGEFCLKKDYNAGYYEVRAYTMAMLNFAMEEIPHEKETWAFFYDESYEKQFFQENHAMFSRVVPVYNAVTTPGDYSLRHIRIRPQITGMNRMDNDDEGKPSVSFFPEGGSLVNGLVSRIAFEVTSEEGEHAEATLTVDDSGSTVKTGRLGRGDFYFMPADGSPRTVTVGYKGKEYKYRLPEASPQGYVMTVTRHRNGDYIVSLQRSENTGSELLGFSVICRGKPVVSQIIDMEEAAMEFSVPADKLPTGVNQLTLFNDKGVVFAERMVFVNHHDYNYACLLVKSKSEACEPAEHLSVDLSVKQKSGKVSLVGSSVSVSISEEATRETLVSEQNILTNLLLSSDLKGFIESPSYYFEKETPKRLHDLDLLLLIQGWRRYDWNKMSGNEQFIYRYPYERSFRISGTVYPQLGFKFSRNKRLSAGMGIGALLIKDSIEYYGSDSVGSDGDFSFSLPEFEGDGLLFIWADDSKSPMRKENAMSDFFQNKLNYEDMDGGHWYDEYIPLRENYKPHQREFAYYETHPLSVHEASVVGEERQEAIGNGTGEAYSIILKEVSVAKRRRLYKVDFSQPAVRFQPYEELNYQLDNGLFFGPVSRFSIATLAAFRLGMRGYSKFLVNRRDVEKIDITGNDIARGNDMSYYMQRYLGKERDRLSDNTRTVIPDSIAYRKFSTIENTEHISIYTDKNYRGTQDFADVRDGYSYNFVVNFEAFRDPHKSVPMYRWRRLTYHGYSKVADFYHPDYSKKPLGEIPADYRRTLYWNPDVRTDSDGNARIEFYNNSTCRHLHISAEGLTSDGQPLVYEK